MCVSLNKILKSFAYFSWRYSKGFKTASTHSCQAK